MKLLRAIVLCAALCWALLVTASASAKFKTGLMDGLFAGNAQQRAEVRDDALAARADFVRLNLSWRGVATGKPATPTDPSDPAYNFAAIDAQVIDAAARDLAILLTVTRAPNFAEQGKRPNNAPPGTWKPSPKALRQFAQAVATRYDGAHGLPRVRFFQAWNEANLSTYLAPQYVGRKPFGANHYKRMLNSFYRGVHAAQPNAKVVSTGTGPYGDPPGGKRTRPLAFWRKVFCLKGRKALKPQRCKVKPRMDIFAHHPINTSGGPKRSALHPDDASTPDFKHVRRVVRKAERAKRVLPRKKRRPLWATELWWESKPGDRCGVTQKKQARYLAQAFKLLRRQGASAVFWLSVRDQPPRPRECGRETMQSGLITHDGVRKQSFRAFRRFG